MEGFEDFGDHGHSEFVANHASIFMVRGLKTNWKQPVGYFLSSGPIPSERLYSLFLDCIDELQKIGLDVKVVIADQGSNNRSAFTKFLKVTEQEPFFFPTETRIFLFCMTRPTYSRAFATISRTLDLLWMVFVSVGNTLTNSSELIRKGMSAQLQN